jgi:hypothetical protein
MLQLFGDWRTSRPATSSADDTSHVHAAAARGTATTSAQLPFFDQIQRAFGRHDISGIKAHVGGDATASAREMGAKAYATGNHVVLGDGADLHTVAHEAAHVVQQRGGVQLKGGVGEMGDAYERQADEVALLVVHGKSAESLLDSQGPTGGPTLNTRGSVQRLVMIGENHKESEMRKDAEKDFCAQKFGPGYYEENEYCWGGEPGDPKEMGAMRYLADVVFGSNSLIKGIASDDGATWEDRDWEVTQEIMESVQLDVADALHELCLLRQGKTRAVYRDYAKLAQGAFEQLKNLQSALATTLQSVQERKLQEFNNNKDKLLEAHVELEVVIGFEEGKVNRAELLNKIDRDRDKAMAESLYVSKDVKGVWKVGQNHINGIWKAINDHDPGWAETHRCIVDEDLFTQFFHNWYMVFDKEGYDMYMKSLRKHRNEEEDLHDDEKEREPEGEKERETGREK